MPVWVGKNVIMGKAQGESLLVDKVAPLRITGGCVGRCGCENGVVCWAAVQTSFRSSEEGNSCRGKNAYK